MNQRPLFLNGFCINATVFTIFAVMAEVPATFFNMFCVTVLALAQAGVWVYLLINNKD